MPVHKKGKNNRKHGRHADQIRKSHWQSFANVIAKSDERKRERIRNRICPTCRALIQSRGALKRHMERATCKQAA